MVGGMVRAVSLSVLVLVASCSAGVSDLPAVPADGGIAAQSDAQPNDAAAPDAAARDAGLASCTDAPLVLHASAGKFEGLSLASNGDRWALTYAHVPPDGAEEATYFVIVDAEGRPTEAARPVEPYSRVVALGDKFLLVGPNLETPLFELFDRDGVRIQRSTLAPTVLGRGTIGTLQSTGDTVVGVAHDNMGDHVFTVRASESMVIAHALDLPPITAESIVYGLHPDRVLRASTVRTWDMEASVLVMERTAAGAWIESFALDTWIEGPNNLHAARWIDSRREWWILGTRRIETEWHAARIGRISEEGVSLGSSSPPMRAVQYTGYPRGTLELAGSRAAILFSTGTNLSLVGMIFSVFNDQGTVLGDSDLAFENTGDARALLAWNPSASRFAALGVDTDAGLVFRCDLRDDGDSADLEAVPIEPTDRLPEQPPAVLGPCGPDSPIVAVNDPLGVRLLGFARAGDAFAVVTEAGLIVTGEDGVERARVPYALAVAELEGVFLVAAQNTQHLELIDPSGAKLGEAAFSTVIHEQRASFGGLVARADRALLHTGGELFAIRWNGGKLEVGTSTPAPELGLLGLEPDRALFSRFDGSIQQYVLRPDGTWSFGQAPGLSRLERLESAAWSPNEQRWWVSGALAVLGTPYWSTAIERVDPVSGQATFERLNVPATRRWGSKLLIEPSFAPGSQEAILIGERFFGTSLFSQRIDRGYGPYTAMIAPERETASFAYAYEGGTVPNELPQRTRRRWIEVRCGLR
jgi:hypothetical protein